MTFKHELLVQFEANSGANHNHHTYESALSCRKSSEVNLEALKFPSMTNI